MPASATGSLDAFDADPRQWRFTVFTDIPELRGRRVCTMGLLKGIAIRGARRAAMEEVDSVSVSVESGIAGDRHGDFAERQVTILSTSDWQAACDELNADLSWTMRRANLLLDGMVLPRAPGARVRIGECLLEITGETDPCERMDEQYDGLRRALTPDWRGGRTCRVVSGGGIRVGDSAEIVGV
ncbi:MAG: MOSC domain-containing protein [Rhodospirillaceae bacterium]|nr:MOSC domain-containing protein [Rhodospirillaceae bacterium]